MAKLHVKVHNTGSLRAALQKYDNIVVSLGFDKSTESEGFDRTFAIDPMQINLLNEAIATGKNVIVVINSGGGVEMASWIDKVMLKRGETKRISIKLSRDAFSFYDVKQHQFTAEPGEFVIHAGPSSATLPLSATVKF